MSERLKVGYKTPKKISKVIDRVIKEAIIKLGYKWYASGYNFLTKYRDLDFEKGKK